MPNAIEPFFYYSPDFTKILKELNITLVYSTYQAGKLIFISSLNGKNIAKYAKNFPRPMGIAYDPDQQKIAIASKTNVDVFSSNRKLSLNYLESPKKYDCVFVPQSRYYTGYLDTHEIEFGNGNLWVVNTLFSCISKMSEGKHFEVYWKPDFITDILPEDRCHLNGLALENGMPAYVTMFGQTNEKKGWRKAKLETGILMDIRSNEILCDQLPMPHTPTLYKDKIYFLTSATGEIMCHDLPTGNTHKVAELKSFLRGLIVMDDYLIVAGSKLREKSTKFGELPISSEETFCGIYIINRHTGENLGGIKYTGVINEIFSLKVLKNIISPALLTERDEYHNKCIMTDHKGVNFWMRKVEENEEELQGV